MTAFINSLELSIRASNALRRIEPPIDSAEKFLALDRDFIRLQPHAGNRTWAEIKRMQDYLRGENIDTETTPQPKHPTALPDIVARRLSDLARAHGYSVGMLELVWLTKDLGEPPIARVRYAPSNETEVNEAQPQAQPQPQPQPKPPQRGDIYIDPPGVSGTWIVRHTDPNGASDLIHIQDDFRLHTWRVATKDLRNPARNSPLWAGGAK